MKQIKKEKIEELWEDDCKICGRKIYGYTIKQVNRLMFMHKGSNSCMKIRKELKE